MNPQELEQMVLRASREQMAPSASDRMRNQAAFLAKLAEPLPTSAPPKAFGSRVLRGGGVGLSIGLLLGGLIGFEVGASLREPGETTVVTDLLGSDQQPEQPSLAAREETEVPVVEGLAREPMEASAASPIAREPIAREPVVEQPVVEQPVAERAVHSGRRKSSRPSHLKRPAGVVDRSSLAEELALLQRARRALNRDNGSLALGLVEELDKRFAQGVLVEERLATRVLALCQLKRTEEAQSHGRRFLAEHPGSIYVDRVRSSCVTGSERAAR